MEGRKEGGREGEGGWEGMKEGGRDGEKKWMEGRKDGESFSVAERLCHICAVITSAR